MPHVEIKCYPGRTEERKQLCTEKIVQSLTEALGCPASSITVAITEIPQEDWKKTVWDVSIAPAVDSLYKKPEYTCE